jgi:hypothetical protein
MSSDRFLTNAKSAEAQVLWSHGSEYEVPDLKSEIRTKNQKVEKNDKREMDSHIYKMTMEKLQNDSLKIAQLHLEEPNELHGKVVQMNTMSKKKLIPLPVLIILATFTVVGVYLIFKYRI